MKLIIDLDKIFYEGCKKGRILDTTIDHLVNSIASGTPITDNATNGEVMRAIFPDGVKTSIAYPRDVSKEWINAPYQKGGTSENNI